MIRTYAALVSAHYPRQDSCLTRNAGQSASTDVCAVCTHSPLDASTCTPNKALRLTVKAFVKSEERKRNRDVKPSVPVTHVEASKHEAVIDAPSARAAPGSAPVSTTEAHPTPSNDVNRPDDAPLSQDVGMICNICEKTLI